MTRLNCLESLRGILALWVVIGHILRRIYADDHPPFLNILLNPVLAVDIFIILSGFVIFFLLDKTSPSYNAFIVGRWFRLAPLYFFTLVISTLTLTGQTEAIKAWPIQNSSVLTDMKLHNDSIASLKVHFLAHLSLLHGLIPDFLLPSSQFAIVGVAWSISVEWQFYLFAPFIFFLVRRAGWHRICYLAIAVSALKLAGVGGMGSVIQQAHLFMIGIGSYYLWKYSSDVRLDARLLDALTVIAIALILFVATRAVALAIWCLFMNMVLASHLTTASKFRKLMVSFVESKPLLFLGRISYSMYLLHMLVLYSASSLFANFASTLPKSTLAWVMVITVTSTTILLSILTYKYIEQPGINAGRRLSAWLANRRRIAESPLEGSDSSLVIK